MKRYTLIGGPRHQQQLTHTPTADSSEGALPSSITVTDPQEPWKQIEYLAKTWVTADAEKAMLAYIDLQAMYQRGDNKPAPDRPWSPRPVGPRAA